MKTLRSSLCLILSGWCTLLQAQNIDICLGESYTLTVPNPQNLSSPSYTLYPQGAIGTGPNFVVSPTTTINYTMVVGGINSSSTYTTDTATVSIIPWTTTFSLSASIATLNCAMPVVTVSILNAMSVPPASPLSYSFIPPGSSTILPSGPLSSFTAEPVSMGGLWTVAVRENNHGCTVYDNFYIFDNKSNPVINVTSVPPLIDCTNPFVILTANSTVGTATWSTGAHSNSIVVNASSVPGSSVAATVSVTAVDAISGCLGTSTIKVYQNLYPPVAQINSGVPLSQMCFPAGTLMLTNQSSSGVPPGTAFSTTLPVVAQLWQGPGSQPTVSMSTSYVAAVSGVYTMTAVDMNNGCEDTHTVNVNFQPVAAYVHTVANGQATFQSISAGTGPGSQYFWSFGNGFFAAAQDPVHGYSNGGSYPVKLKIINPGVPTCIDSVIQSVNITGAPCVANPGFSMAPTATSQVWNVIPAYPWNVSNAVWDWGDGSSSNTLYTSHQYSAAGMYNICLSVTVSCVASSSTCTSYSVYRSSQAANIIAVNVIEPDLVNGLSAISSDVVAWKIVPHPNNGHFHLQSEAAQYGHVIIRDLTGRVVFEDIIEKAEGHHAFEFDLRHLPGGVYLLSVGDGFSQQTQKLVISK